MSDKVSSLQVVHKVMAEAHSPSDIMGRAMGGIPDRVSEVLVLSGAVKWFDVAKGYGFLVPDNGMGDVFVHASHLRHSGFGIVGEGDRMQVRAFAKQNGKLVCAQVLSVNQ